MVDISDLFAEKEPLFLDGCSFNKSSGWFRNSVVPYKYYGDLELDGIKTASDEYELFTNYLLSPSTEAYFPPKVLEEMVKFKAILDNKFEHMESAKSWPLSNEDFEKRRSLISVRSWYDNLLNLAKSKVYSNDSEKDFNILNNLLIKISEKNNLKVKRYRKPEFAKKSKEDLRADEELVSCAVYHCLQKDIPVKLITGDRDVMKILACFTIVLCQNGKLQNFVDNLYKYPVRSYNIVQPDNNYADTREIIDSVKDGTFQKYL